jgi:hypothetical protein
MEQREQNYIKHENEFHEKYYVPIKNLGKELDSKIGNIIDYVQDHEFKYNKFNLSLEWGLNFVGLYQN